MCDTIIILSINIRNDKEKSIKLNTISKYDIIRDVVEEEIKNV